MNSPETIDDVPQPDPDTTLAPPTATVAPPSVPGFEIVGELGRGGMGVVYRARQTALNRDVALKLILAGGHASAGDLARFRLEAEAVARFQHPNVVQIYEVGDADGRPYFALEFVPGGTLATKLNGAPLPPREAAAVVETLARAVDHAHAKGVIHRDLKPGNVLLTADGTPKVADFGLAKRLDANDARTASGAVLGTPSYMAPEQAGGGDVGPPADVYALGAILYECLTGRPPFRAATPFETALQVLSDEPVAPSQLQTATPRDLNTVALKCLEKSPAKRYPSAVALADDLRRYLAGEPILARPVVVVERCWKWAKRRPAAAALLIVSALALAGLLGGGLWYNAKLQVAITDIERERAAVRRGQYAANVILAQKAADSNDWDRVRELLDAGRPRPGEYEFRGFEWHYLDSLGRTEVVSADATDFAWLPGGATLAVLGRETSAPAGRPVVNFVDALTGGSRLFVRLAIPVGATRGGMAASDDARLLAVATNAESSGRLTLVSAGGETVRTYDVRGRCRLPTFSPDARRVAVVGENVVVRDTSSGATVFERPFPDHKQAIACAFDRTGERLAVIGWTDCWLWNLAAGGPGDRQPLEQFRTEEFDFVAAGRPVSPQLLAIGKDLNKLPDDAPPSVIAWTRDRSAWAYRGRSSLYVGSPDSDTGRVTLRGNEDEVVDFAFNGNGRFLAALVAGRVKVWRPTMASLGVARRTKPFDPDYEHGVTFAPDGRRVAATTPSGELAVYDDRTGETVAELRDGGRRLGRPAFLPDGRLAAVTTDDPLEILVFNTDEPAKVPRRYGVGSEQHVLSFAVRHDGSEFAVAVTTAGRAGRPDQVVLLDPCAVRPAVALPLTAGHRSANCLAYSPDGSQIASADGDAVRFWPVPTYAGSPCSDVKLGRPIASIRYARDGRFLIAVGEGGGVSVVDAAAGRVRQNLRVRAADAVLSPDGRRLFTLHPDDGVRVWDAETGTELLTIRAADPADPAAFAIAPCALTLSPDGTRLAVVGIQGGVRVWDLVKPTLAEIDRREAVVGKD